MRRLRYLTHRRRFASTNGALGGLLAFTAGAVNAGGFLVLHAYTSHMTGFASQLADGTVLGDSALVLSALGALLAFAAGAAVCAVLATWGRQHRLHSVYALPLLLEAGLLMVFGAMGALAIAWRTPFTVPLTVLLLSFVMGLQNAVASKTSAGNIRTTHMTGNLTDLGIEIGKFCYWSGPAATASPPAGAPAGVRHDAARMRRAAGLLGMFVAGGLAGALGFKFAGFVCVIPLAALLLAVSLPPLQRDLRRSKAFAWTPAARRWRSGRS